MTHFFEEKTAEALSLGNRGPLEIDGDSNVRKEILDKYWDLGFYVFENVIKPDEMAELKREFKDLLARTPSGRLSDVDCQGRPLPFDEEERKLFRFVKPLSDPYGGTDTSNSRYQVKIKEPPLPEDAPKEVLLQIGGIMQFMTSSLRVYGHPELLALAEAVNGEDFTPFTEVIWLKQPRVGAAVSWHQDGTTHWDNPELDEGTHGFNFMLNLYETIAENSLWVVPGTHKQGKADIKSMLADSSSEHLEGAVPLLCKPGDVAIVNRQIVHGSFPNQSEQPRYTFVFGFHRRASVAGVQGWAQQPFSEQYLNQTSQLIPLAIAARAAKYPRETPYTYQPLLDSDAIGWDEISKEKILKHYHKRFIGI